jgi:hypothetical protein
LLRCEAFTFSAAVINMEHTVLAQALPVPTIVYGTADVPMRPQAIVAALVRRLAR